MSFKGVIGLLKRGLGLTSGRFKADELYGCFCKFFWGGSVCGCPYNKR